MKDINKAVEAAKDKENQGSIGSAITAKVNSAKELICKLSSLCPEADIIIPDYEIPEAGGVGVKPEISYPKETFCGAFTIESGLASSEQQSEFYFGCLEMLAAWEQENQTLVDAETIEDMATYCAATEGFGLDCEKWPGYVGSENVSNNSTDSHNSNNSNANHPATSNPPSPSQQPNQVECKVPKVNYSSVPSIWDRVDVPSPCGPEFPLISRNAYFALYQTFPECTVEFRYSDSGKLIWGGARCTDAPSFTVSLGVPVDYETAKRFELLGIAANPSSPANVENNGTLARSNFMIEQTSFFELDENFDEMPGFLPKPLLAEGFFAKQEDESEFTEENLEFKKLNFEESNHEFLSKIEIAIETTTENSTPPEEHFRKPESGPEENLVITNEPSELETLVSQEPIED